MLINIYQFLTILFTVPLLYVPLKKYLHYTQHKKK